MRELRDRRESFGFETTLASRTFARFLREAQARGYLVHVLYVSLASADLAVQRVGLRVLEGGHDIPEDTVRRRYRRSHANFFGLYRPLADTWSVCDNSGDVLTPVAYGRTGSTPTILDEAVWTRVRARGTTDG